MPEDLSAEEARQQREIIISRLMPELVKACGKTPTKDNDTITITESAFGESPREMELLGIAIRYSVDHGFNVKIVPMMVENNHIK